MLQQFLIPQLDEDDQEGRSHFQEDGAPLVTSEKCTSTSTTVSQVPKLPPWKRRRCTVRKTPILPAHCSIIGFPELDEVLSGIDDFLLRCKRCPAAQKGREEDYSYTDYKDEDYPSYPVLRELPLSQNRSDVPVVSACRAANAVTSQLGPGRNPSVLL
ncbi:uncharacterized protein LOC110827027 isoform X2 [Zootermopsis nevadensis]|nr:uncharacterized protein LOC110827027 isoform X2 [Zootermopsis nevadensis]